VADDVDGLFGLPLEEFTRARDALARELRSAGRKDEAAEVGALRKPVLPAWVVNRLVREQPKATKALLGAAEAIRSGRAGGDERMREALDELMRAARKVLEAEGREPADTVLREVATTLRTGAGEDPDALSAGRLTRPLEPSGFAAMAGTKLPPRRKARAARVEKDARDETRVEKARVDADAARKEARRLASEAADAEREARRLRSEADRAERRLRDAEDRLAKARGRSSRSPSTRMS
jgi:hypothetical protein